MLVKKPQRRKQNRNVAEQGQTAQAAVIQNRPGGQQAADSGRSISRNRNLPSNAQFPTQRGLRFTILAEHDIDIECAIQANNNVETLHVNIPENSEDQGLSQVQNIEDIMEVELGTNSDKLMQEKENEDHAVRLEAGTKEANTPAGDPSPKLAKVQELHWAQRTSL